MLERQAAIANPPPEIPKVALLQPSGFLPKPYDALSNFLLPKNQLLPENIDITEKQEERNGEADMREFVEKFQNAEDIN